MTLALIVVASLLGLAALGSAIAKVTKKADVMASMAHVGVPTGRIPLLASLELLGALGLAVGIWFRPVGLAAAIGLLLYFAGAVGAHTKVKDSVQEYGPAFVLFLVACVTVYLEYKRF